MLLFLIKAKKYYAYCYEQYIWAVGSLLYCGKQCYFYQAWFCWISFFFTADLLQHIKALNLQKQNQQTAFFMAPLLTVKSLYLSPGVNTGVGL